AGADTIYMEPRQDAVSPRNPRLALDIGHDDGRDRGAIMRLFWTALVIIGVVVLMGQLIYIYRAQLANNLPVFRPMLERACATLHCKVPYSRHIDQISIMSSSLRVGPRPPADSAEAALAGAADGAGAV